MSSKKSVKKGSGQKKSVKTVKKGVKVKEKSVAVKPVDRAKDNHSETEVAEGGRALGLLRGMKDVLPKEDVLWRQIMRAADAVSEAYGFQYISTPILEDANLFVRTIGKGTDIVDKEMYIFENQDGKKIGLRPEMTASVARAYIDHGLHTIPQPVKVWHLGPMFRHDRPQSGRYRQFTQFDCEVLGERDPEIDAELIALAWNFMRDLGVSTQVHINSIGTLEDRERYLVQLTGYFRTKRAQLSEESKKRLQRNPLRILDSKEEEDKLVIEEAPQIIDWLSEDSRKYFTKVLEYLDELEIPYLVQPTLVRGLDYYSDTVFEFYDDAEEVGRQNSLGGGGRYDRLVEQLGGKPTPACGFALGLERVVSLMRKHQEEGKTKTLRSNISPVFFAHIGEQSRRRTLKLLETLRRSGINVHHALSKASLKNQLELANKSGDTHALILGQKELQDGTVIIRDMASGIQEIIDQNSIVSEMKKLLSRSA